MLEHVVIKHKIKKYIRFPVLFCGCVPLSKLFAYSIAEKPVTLATLVRRPPVTFGHTFMKPESYYVIILGRYSVTWPTVYLESWTQLHV